MNSVMTQKKKTVILASSIACFQMPMMLMITHFHDSSFLPAIVIGWVLVMVSLLAYVMVNLAKLLRMRRGGAR